MCHVRKHCAGMWCLEWADLIRGPVGAGIMSGQRWQDSVLTDAIKGEGAHWPSYFVSVAVELFILTFGVVEGHHRGTACLSKTPPPTPEPSPVDDAKSNAVAGQQSSVARRW